MWRKMIAIVLCICMFSKIYVLGDEIEDEYTKEELAEALQVGSEISEEPRINSRAAVIYDRKSKKVIWGKAENDKRKMASTTKIMTAIIVLENGNMNDIVTVSKKAAGTGGSRLGLKAGDKISVSDLLYGLLLVSGNDAAVCLAEHIGGSVENFAEMMNKKAVDLGLENTHFVTPHGLDQDEHYTTAFELARMADFALENKTFANIVATRNYTVNINGYPKQLNNTNELLGNLYGVNGVKTGFTNGANRCLVSSIKRDEMNIITVVLGADTKKNRTQDSVKLIEYAYKNYKIFNMGEFIKEEYKKWEEINESRIVVKRAKKMSIDAKLGDIEYEYLPIKNEDEKDIRVEFDCNMEIEGNVDINEKIGEMNIFLKNKKIMVINIVSSEYIKEKEYIDYLKEIVFKYTSFLERNI